MSYGKIKYRLIKIGVSHRPKIEYRLALLPIRHLNGTVLKAAKIYINSGWINRVELFVRTAK